MPQQPGFRINEFLGYEFQRRQTIVASGVKFLRRRAPSLLHRIVIGPVRSKYLHVAFGMPKRDRSASILPVTAGLGENGDKHAPSHFSAISSLRYSGDGRVVPACPRR